MEKITVFCTVEVDLTPEFLNQLQEIGNGTITVLELAADCWLEREIEPEAKPNA